VHTDAELFLKQQERAMNDKEGVQQQKDREAPPRRRFLHTAARVAALAGGAGLTCGLARAASDSARQGGNGRGDWVTTWAGVAHGTYPSGTAILQPNLTFAFPNSTTSANDQSFRMIVRPTVWGDTFRLRFSNVFGTQPRTLDDIYLGLQATLLPRRTAQGGHPGRSTTVERSGLARFRPRS
jgi:hypothetical protein